MASPKNKGPSLAREDRDIDPTACFLRTIQRMAAPTHAVTLEPQQISILLKEFATARHDINNALSLISAAAELIRMNPDNLPKMLPTMNEQPAKIGALMQKFTTILESNLRTARASVS